MSPKKRRASANGRMLDGRELFDRTGDVYRYSRDLTRAEIELLIDDPTCQTVIYKNWGALRWIEVADRRSTWNNELSPNLKDVPNWKPPRGAPGQLPFVAELWTSAGLHQLLLFNDHD
jgi:hypothetical protein